MDSYYGIGILKSDDGGKTWLLSTGSGGLVDASTLQYNLDGPFVGASVSKIVIDPSQKGHVLAAVSSPSFLSTGKSFFIAIYESPDSGKSWTAMKVSGISGNSYNCTDLIYDPSSHSFYSAIEGFGIYRYMSGSGWVPTTSPFESSSPNAFNFYRASLATGVQDGKNVIFTLISAGDFGDRDPRNYDLSRPGPLDTGIVQSIDEGQHWTPVAPPPQLFNVGSGGQGFYDQYILIIPGTNNLIVGGIDVWLTSSVVSPQWKNVTQAYDYSDAVVHPNLHVHPDQHAALAFDPDHWVIGSDGGVWRTDDGGSRWVDLNTNISSIQLMSVTALRTPGGGYLGGSQDNGTALGRSGPQPWTTTLTGDGGFTADNPSDQSQYFTERYGVSLCQTHYPGAGWSTVVHDGIIPDVSSFYVPFQLIHTKQDEIVLGTQRVWLGPAAPHVAGNGWNPISNFLALGNDYIQAISAAPGLPNLVYVSTTDSKVFFNQDVEGPNAISNWVNLTTPQLPFKRVFGALAVDPVDPKWVYLGVQGFGTGHVFLNRGDGTWHDITPKFPDGQGHFAQLDTPVNAILIDPRFRSDVYIATDIGVFLTSDQGGHWQQWGPNLPHVAVLGLKMRPDRSILAATHGRGAWTIVPVE